MTNGLERYLNAQEGNFESALSEIEAGKKVSHWMWYIFPQMKGLGKSSTSNYYGITSKIEATEYLSHEILGPRLRACTISLLKHSDRPVKNILGGIDSLKLKSSMTLFYSVSSDSIFEEVLNTFYDGKKCKRTLDLLQD